jgi:ribosomal protein L11
MNKKIIVNITYNQLFEILKEKMTDLNCGTISHVDVNTNQDSLSINLTAIPKSLVIYKSQQPGLTMMKDPAELKSNMNKKIIVNIAYDQLFEFLKEKMADLNCGTISHVDVNTNQDSLSIHLIDTNVGHILAPFSAKVVKNLKWSLDE